MQRLQKSPRPWRGWQTTSPGLDKRDIEELLERVPEEPTDGELLGLEHTAEEEARERKLQEKEKKTPQNIHVKG